MKDAEFSRKHAMVNALMKLGGGAHYNKWFNEPDTYLLVGKADFDAIPKDFLICGIGTRNTLTYGKRQERQLYRLLDFPNLFTIKKYPDKLPSLLEEGLTQMSRSERKYFMKDLASRVLFAVDSTLLMHLFMNESEKDEFFEGWLTGWVKQAQVLFELFKRIDDDLAWEIFQEWESTRTLKDAGGQKSKRLLRFLQEERKLKVKNDPFKLV